MNKVLNTVVLALAIFLTGNWLFATPYPGGALLNGGTIDGTLIIKANTPGTVGSHAAGQLIIQDPDDNVFNNAVITGYESDGNGNPDQQLWYLGSSSGSNTDITFLNRKNSNLTLGTNDTTHMTLTGGGDVSLVGQLGTTIATIDVDGASTFVVTRNVINLTCEGAESIDTITAGISGQLLTLIHQDTDCTLNDDDPATASDAIDLLGTATNSVGAASKAIQLVYNGSNWFEIGPAGGAGDATHTLADGAVLLGTGAATVGNTGVLADGEFIVGDGTTAPVLESGDTARISLGVGTTDTPTFGEVHITSAGTPLNKFSVTNTDGTDRGLREERFQDSGTSAVDNDFIYELRTSSDDSGGTKRITHRLNQLWDDVTSTTMDSSWSFYTMDNVNAGNAATIATLTSLGAWADAPSFEEFKTWEPQLTTKQVLTKLRTLKVERFRGRGAPDIKESERHIGPAADTFYQTFKAGKDPRVNNKEGAPQYGIAARDVAGVALMAIQELIKENDKLKERLDALEAN